MNLVNSPAPKNKKKSSKEQRNKQSGRIPLRNKICSLCQKKFLPADQYAAHLYLNVSEKSEKTKSKGEESTDKWLRYDTCAKCKQDFLQNRAPPFVQWEGRVPPQVKGQKQLEELKQHHQAWRLLQLELEEENWGEAIPFISFLLLYLLRCRVLILRKELEERKQAPEGNYYEVVLTGEIILAPAPIPLERSQLLELEQRFLVEARALKEEELEE